MMKRDELDDERDCGKWSKEEDILLKKAVDCIGARNWKRISTEFLGGKRSDVQCLHRWQKVLKPGLIKGPWTKEEDDTIMDAIKSGVTKWSEIATLIPGRIGKQCRERWFNHLDPSIKKGAWSEEEDRILVEYQEKLGNRWCEIAKVLPGRSENAVKNRWNSAMRRKFQQKRNIKPGSSSAMAMKASAVAQANALSIAQSHHQNALNSSDNQKLPKIVRNNVRLPPEAILVEQPTNRNSVIAAREKIRRHQEQMEQMLKSGGTGKVSYTQTIDAAAMAQATSAETLDAVAAAVARAKAQAAGNMNIIKHQGKADGENCSNVSNISGGQYNNCKRSISDADFTNDRSRKRTKKSEGTAKLSKGVSNLLQFAHFCSEMMKRKVFSSQGVSENEKLLLHQRALKIIEDASQGGGHLTVSTVWARLSEWFNQGGLQQQQLNSFLDPLPLSVNKGKPQDLRVQCSLDPSQWTMSGGTPIFSQNMMSPNGGDLLSSMLAPFPQINASIFSPTPRHSNSGNISNFGCATPLHQVFRTPTAAEIKKIDQLDDPLFPESMFFNMDSSTLSTLNGVGTSTVLSPIFRNNNSSTPA